MTLTPRGALAAPTRTVARHHPDDARVQWHAELTEICRAEIGMNEAFASLHAAAILRAVGNVLADQARSALRPVLKPHGFLTRDSRVVERKKYGKAKARRSFQFSKR